MQGAHPFALAFLRVRLNGLFSVDDLREHEHFLSSFPKVPKLSSTLVFRLGIGRPSTASVGQSHFIQTLNMVSDHGIGEDQLSPDR